METSQAEALGLISSKRFQGLHVYQIELSAPPWIPKDMDELSDQT